MSRYAMIMAGGAGTRLWPMSRRGPRGHGLPKQLLPLIDGKSLIELAAERIEGLVPPRHRYICASEAHRAAILKALHNYGEDQYLGEPEGRDTLNAIGLTAAVLAKRDPKAIFAVLTADHIIEPQDEFAACIDLGFRLVENDPKRLVTFAIKPTHATKAFGYVTRGKALSGFEGGYVATSFVEKPEPPEAQKLIDQGAGWNSGMFVFAAKTFVQALEWFKPANHRGLMTIADAWDTPHRRAVLHEIYPTLEKISVDYAVMMPVAKDDRLIVCAVPMDVTWLDVGSWPSYAKTLPADAQSNRTNCQMVHLKSKGVLAVSDDPKHTIATIGCEDLIIVHTRDATLVCRADRAEDVKKIAGMADPSVQ